MFAKVARVTLLALYATSVARGFVVNRRAGSEDGDESDSAALISASEPTFIDCSPAQEQHLRESITIAMSKHAQTVQYLRRLERKKTSKPVWDAFKARFSDAEASYLRPRYKLVREVFELLPGQPLAEASYICEKPESYGPNTPMVDDDTQKIVIGDEFWALNPSSIQTAEVLIHKWMYFGRDKYGHRGAVLESTREFGRENPSAGIKSANLAKFAMDAKYPETGCGVQ